MNLPLPPWLVDGLNFSERIEKNKTKDKTRKQQKTRQGKARIKGKERRKKRF